MDVILSLNARKQYKHFPKADQKKIRKKLIVLENDPIAGKKLMGEFKGVYSLRVWPYRILYEINMKIKRVEILVIAHRQGIYK
ncbi:type II toxin-antitoxin system RelE/ParE family toxin [Patescibacteria group bacterium]|nr:type II toxin-antitoxin system RelE/ParE family toxin [Patescibacteria group bacterium]